MLALFHKSDLLLCLLLTASFILGFLDAALLVEDLLSQLVLSLRGQLLLESLTLLVLSLGHLVLKITLVKFFQVDGLIGDFVALARNGSLARAVLSLFLTRREDLLSAGALRSLVEPIVAEVRVAFGHFSRDLG